MKALLLWMVSLAVAPLFSALILKVKAFFGGRQGPPLLINYYTLAKLMRKGSVYSTSTTFLFPAGPLITLSVALIALLFLPIAGHDPVISFPGDVILVIYLFGLARFFTITSALDTASPFEGMGAAREAWFSILCEATLFMMFILFYLRTGELRIASFFAGQHPLKLWQTVGAPLLFVLSALFLVTLTENARVPVDDPATHLELTMIHEVMVLDHSGPDFAIIEMGRFLKLYVFGSLLARLISPWHTGLLLVDLANFWLGLLLVFVAIGVTESMTARFRMDKVPKFVLTSFALVFFATVITLELMP